jgi:hypothetical protein
MILKGIKNKQGARIWSGLNWFSKGSGVQEILVIMKMKCGFQNGKKFVDDLSEGQFSQEKLLSAKKKIAHQITTNVTQIKVALVLKQLSIIIRRCIDERDVGICAC